MTEVRAPDRAVVSERRSERGARAAGPGAGARRGARQGQQDRVLYEGAACAGPDAVRVLCCVDDTDDLSGDTSTGYVAEQIAQTVAGLGGHVVLGVTRHQLLLAEGVPYTSHNSAMCVEARLPADRVPAFRSRAIELIAEHRAAASDPGLCVAVVPGQEPDRAQGASERARFMQELRAFGLRAQQELCEKHQALGLAERIPWVHLSEHGGTGDGVIGALAGVGLRLGGADGRFRGKWDLVGLVGSKDAGGCVAAHELCASLGRRVRGRVRVVDGTGADVPAGTPVALVRGAKPILHEAALAFVVEVSDGVAQPAQKVDLGTIGNSRTWQRACERFQLDNDAEECASGLEPSCRNCLFRRFTARGFACELPEQAIA